MIQRNLQASVITVRTDKGTEFKNKTLCAFFKEEGIKHQTSTPRTSEQNEPANSTNADAKKSNNNQAAGTQVHQDEFINPFCTPAREITESSLRNIDISQMHTFNQPQDSKYQWTKYHPLEQVRGNPSKPMQTRRQLAINPEMCVFALTVKPANSTNADAKKSNNNQAAGTQVHQDEFINPFCTPAREITESSLRNIDISQMHTFNQPQDSKYQWTKYHPLEQVRGNPSKPMQTRRQLAINPEMCVFALTVSTAELKTIKEAMANSA
nr:hypothetical protein [Tanacetum cinerariifolium]